MKARYAPFPVETPYRTGPRVTKLARSSDGLIQHFVVDSAYAGYLEQKLARLSRYPERCGGLLESEGLEDALWRALERVNQEQPELVALTAETVELKALGVKLRRSSQSRYTVDYTSADTPSSLGQRAAAHLFSLTSQPGPLVLLHALALCVQEDVVLLEEHDGADRVVALCVAFPSHWSPQAQLGRNFSDVHKPVAHNRALLSAHRPVMNALFHKGPFVRFVWGLSADDALSQHPAEARSTLPQVLNTPDQLAQQLTFRTERQVSCPLSSGHALFTIRVAVQPLYRALGNDPERHRRLAAALASMDDELLAYKRLTAWRDPLLEYLDTAYMGSD